MKQHLHLWKKPYVYIYTDIHVWEETYNRDPLTLEREFSAWALSMRRDLWIWKEIYIYEERRIYMRRGLHTEKRPINMNREAKLRPTDSL